MSVTPGRHFCPRCEANAADDECATRSGRDHQARRDWRRAWDLARAALATPAETDERALAEVIEAHWWPADQVPPADPSPASVNIARLVLAAGYRRTNGSPS